MKKSFERSNRSYSFSAQFGFNRDVKWYEASFGVLIHRRRSYVPCFKTPGHKIYLQWHADTADDPILGGSVIRILVSDVKTMFDDWVKRGTVHKDKLSLNTARDP